MSPLRERMIEDMILAGLALGTRQAYTQAVRRLTARYRRSPDQLSEEEVRGYLLELRQQGAARGTFKIGLYGLRFFYQRTLHRDWDLFRGKKSSSYLGRSGCLMRCRRIRSVSCSATSATRSPGRASPPCMRAACASAKPPGWRSAPSTAPTRCCVSLAKATRSGWYCCLSRFSTSWARCGGAIATRAGCSPTGAGTGRSINVYCRIPSPPRLTRRVFATR
jgi:hypothetical protein